MKTLIIICLLFFAGCNTHPVEIQVIDRTEQVVALLVPLYCYPDYNNWNKIAVAQQDVSITVIVNPNSGVGGKCDPVYAKSIKMLQNANVIVSGYIYSSYADRDIDQIVEEASLYKLWYGIDLYFIDEVANGSLRYYTEVSNRLSGEVIFNTGVAMELSYIPLCKAAVVFEDSNMDNCRDMSMFQSDKFALMAHGINSVQIVLDRAISMGYHYVYITDDVMVNPWDTLPTYWSELITGVAVGNINSN